MLRRAKVVEKKKWWKKRCFLHWGLDDLHIQDNLIVLFEQDLNQQSTSASVPAPSLKTDMLHWKEHYQTAAIFVRMTQMITIK